MTDRRGVYSGSSYSEPMTHQASSKERDSTVPGRFSPRWAACEDITGPRSNALLFAEVASRAHNTGSDIGAVEPAPVGMQGHV
jgi:hypothetical protein